MAPEIRLSIFLAAMFLAGIPSPSSAERAADPGSATAAAGWEERTPGRWNSLAERKVEVRAGGIAAEMTSSPGTGVLWEKKGTWDPAKGAVLSLEISSDGTNAKSDDYRQFGARFPVSVTAVFGNDRQEVPWRTRIAGFFRKILNGFPPAGIRLTYAFGNRAPVGSMYRLGDEETVFILAGEEEKGKKVPSRRNLSEDFLAAYGRTPSGPVTALVVTAERPRGEPGPLASSVSVTPPTP